MPTNKKLPSSALWGSSCWDRRSSCWSAWRRRRCRGRRRCERAPGTGWTIPSMAGGGGGRCCGGRPGCCCCRSQWSTVTEGRGFKNYELTQLNYQRVATEQSSKQYLVCKASFLVILFLISLFSQQMLTLLLVEMHHNLGHSTNLLRSEKGKERRRKKPTPSSY